ncbi:hypothetical protein [Dorea sp. D27]|uniref:hypothetical protein n=1 Tax=Dorea sp. D27 TaxID=658665 RepID=UPI000673988F|nr:hypothetical protein [Dorea sp. D27]
MKVTLYEKRREEPEEMFAPCSNERLIWLLDFIWTVEEDKDARKVRIDSLLNGKMINTNSSSFVIKIN